MISAIAWICVVVILLSYASGRPRFFHWTNMLLCVPVALPALLAGALPSVAISMAFGIIAAVSLWRERRTSDSSH